MRSLRTFSQALEWLNLRNQTSLKVRPHETSHDTLANEGNEIGEERDEDDKQDEGRAIKGQKMLYQPGHQEWDDHMRTHIPFRKWCPYCVAGKCVSGAHRRIQNKRKNSRKKCQ